MGYCYGSPVWRYLIVHISLNLEKLLTGAVFEAFMYFNLQFAYACLLLCWLYYLPLCATVKNSNNYWIKFGDIGI